MNWKPGKTLEQMEKEVILSALIYHRKNKTQTAKALGIAIRTLDYKLAKYAKETPVVDHLEMKEDI